VAPDPLTGGRLRRADRGQRGVGVVGQGRDQPTPSDPRQPGRTPQAARAARRHHTQRSPLSATAVARSNTILPGSWVASRLRHGPSPNGSDLRGPTGYRFGDVGLMLLLDRGSRGLVQGREDCSDLAVRGSGIGRAGTRVGRAHIG
jgi:hypothetical protein